MKALHQMFNTEKGFLISELFPQEREKMVNAILASSIYIREHEAEIIKVWKNGLITFPFWKSIAKDAEEIILSKKHSLIKSSRVFSDQLFYRSTAIFTIDCIVKYAGENPESQFYKAVDLLFIADC